MKFVFVGIVSVATGVQITLKNNWAQVNVDVADFPAYTDIGKAHLRPQTVVKGKVTIIRRPDCVLSLAKPRLTFAPTRAEMI